MSHYFDDFTVVDLRRHAGATQELVDEFFALMGWSLKPQRDFSPQFDVLGVSFDFALGSGGKFQVANKGSYLALDSPK